MRFSGLLGVCIALGSITVGCNRGSDANEVPDASPYIAFAKDLDGFHAWEPFNVTGTAPAGTVHPGEQLIEYLSERPRAGATQFPVGTRLVKEPIDGGVDPTTGGETFFAMVKRGGGFNDGGAEGWEWFELQYAPDGSGDVQIVWRGVAPPPGDFYGASTTVADCNGCHQACGNDSVCAPALALSTLAH